MGVDDKIQCCLAPQICAGQPIIIHGMLGVDIRSLNSCMVHHDLIS